MMRRYAVVYERGPTSFGAYIPDLPGCVAVGKTRKVVERLIREALEMHLEGMAENGDEIPEPTSEVGYVEVNGGRIGSLAGRTSKPALPLPASPRSTRRR